MVDLVKLTKGDEMKLVLTKQDKTITVYIVNKGEDNYGVYIEREGEHFLANWGPTEGREFKNLNQILSFLASKDYHYAWESQCN